MNPDDLDSADETLFWLSHPDVQTRVAAARRENARGETISAEELMADFGLLGGGCSTPPGERPDRCDDQP
jgi:hypothetical protein